MDNFLYDKIKQEILKTIIKPEMYCRRMGLLETMKLLNYRKKAYKRTDILLSYLKSYQTKL